MQQPQPQPQLPSIALEASANSIFEDFLKSGTHGAQWPNRTWCVVQVNNGRPEVFRNEGGTHAELYLLQYLRKQCNTQCLGNVRVYISYSPCSQCSEALIEFKTNVRNLDMEIIAAAPYNCYRISCPVCEKGYFDKNNYEEFSENTRMLHMLSQNGINVRAFEYDLWVTLANLLNMARPDTEQIELYTDESETYNNSYVGDFEGHNYQHTRKQADDFAATDFNNIFSANFKMPDHPDWYIEQNVNVGDLLDDMDRLNLDDNAF